MRVLLTTIGGSGDINPFIAIAIALQARGHEPVMLVNPYFERQIRDAGIEFLPLGETVDLRIIAEMPELMHPLKGPRLALKKFLLPCVPVLIEAVDRAIRELRPDIVLSHPTAYGARWVCERHGVPWAVAVLAPVTWMSRIDPSVLQSWEPRMPPRWYLRSRYRVGRWLMRRVIDRPLNRIRKQYGFPPERDLFHADVHGGVINLGLWSPHFRGPVPDDPPNGRICGFPWFDRHHDFEHPAADIEAFLREGEPPIVFTLGTSVVHAAGDFFQHAVETCRLLNCRGILLTRHREYAPRSLPLGVRAFTYAPYSTLLPRVCATVHHGGIGTTAQALRAGRPTLIVPFAYDQFDHAARTERLGVSLTVPHKKISARALARALRTVMDDPAFAHRAARLGTALSGENGATTAAAALEEAVGGSVSEGSKSATVDATARTC